MCWWGWPELNRRPSVHLPCCFPFFSMCPAKVFKSTPNHFWEPLGAHRTPLGLTRIKPTLWLLPSRISKSSNLLGENLFMDTVVWFLPAPLVSRKRGGGQSACTSASPFDFFFILFLLVGPGGFAMGFVMKGANPAYRSLTPPKANPL